MSLPSWRQLLPSGSILLLALFVPSNGQAEDKPIPELDQPIQQYEANIQKLKSGIEIRLGELRIAGQKEFDLLGEIERIDKKLALEKVRLLVMEERLTSQRDLHAVKLAELEMAEIRLEEVRQHLQVRLRSYYLMGRTGILNVTFSSRTLPDLMLFNDSFRLLLAYDQKLLEEFRGAVNSLKQATSEFQEESARLDQFIAETQAQQRELDATLAEKKDLLQRVKTQKILHEQALREMQRAEVDLRRSLSQLQEKRAYTLKGFLLNKGTMPSPVEGRILRLFGDEVDGQPSSGLLIEVADGKKVRAIFPGRVMAAGYRRGYGNTVIIDHGLSYFTVTARLEKVLVKEGDRVDGGTVIGQAGDIATLFEKGLYFEIRRDTEPVDPMEWITGEGLSLPQSAGATN